MFSVFPPFLHGLKQTSMFLPFLFCHEYFIYLRFILKDPSREHDLNNSLYSCLYKYSNNQKAVE